MKIWKEKIEKLKFLSSDDNDHWWWMVRKIIKYDWKIRKTYKYQIEEQSINQWNKFCSISNSIDFFVYTKKGKPLHIWRLNVDLELECKISLWKKNKNAFAQGFEIWNSNEQIIYTRNILNLI